MSSNPKDRIRVVRVIEMEGPREWIEKVLTAPNAFLQCSQPKVFTNGVIEEKLRITEVIEYGN